MDNYNICCRLSHFWVAISWKRQGPRFVSLNIIAASAKYSNRIINIIRIIARACGLLGARDMEWSEVGDYTADSDEERVFQSAVEEELACYNGRLVVIVIE